MAFTSVSKVYSGARDAKGNSCLKLGTSKVIGEFTFTVPAEVTKVIIKVAKYKANSTTVSVNGTNYTINTASNDGAYTDIEIDTTTKVQTSGPLANLVDGKTRRRIEAYNTHIEDVVSIAAQINRAMFMQKCRNRRLDTPIAIETIAGNSTNTQHRITRVGIDSQTRAQIPTTRLLSRSCYGTHSRHNQQKQFFHLSYYFMDRGFSYRVA